jgi:hypothetical protein
MLQAVIDACDDHDIEYQLDYGTLLGLIREGDLIPWDGDIDISIPSSQIKKLRRTFWRFLTRGWFLNCATMKNEGCAWRIGDLRVVKIKSGAIRYLVPGGLLLDISIRYRYRDCHWWSTNGYVCRAAAHYFEGYETVAFADRSVRIPRNYEQYLSEIYGDWRTPNPWFCAADDGTIVRSVEEKDDGGTRHF